MEKTTIKRAFAVLAFLAIGIALYLQAAEILRRKTAAETDMVHSFYELEENSIDVLFLGSSHLYYGVQPNVLWREQGIPSYVLGSPEQTAAMAWFLLKEALQYQKPKVVVLESYYLWNGELYGSEARLRQAFDGMRFGRTKLEMADTMLSDAGLKEKLTYYIPFLKYHSRWDSLESYDFQTKPYLLGARIDYTVEELKNPGIPKKKRKLPQLSKLYLEKIAELCEENGIAFAVLAVPYGIETDEARYKRRQGINLTLEEMLEEKGIPFLFYQKQKPELIDFSTDFRDRTHLNTAGAEKLTADLGQWLQELYGLEDHRGEDGYKRQEKYLAQYEVDAAEQREHPVSTAD